MAWIIQRAGDHMTTRGWRPASGGPAAKYPTQGEAQEAMDALLQSGLSAMGGKVELKELPQ
jgi:hypothetical protein